ncbi:hypothetical protein PTKU46_79620 [Paraburkholderia terrae]|uniref:hypothetical protein n=1 Tax=Paraburkholderia terrae TaxID=311230 RepID=UPI0030E571C2
MRFDEFDAYAHWSERYAVVRPPDARFVDRSDSTSTSWFRFRDSEKLVRARMFEAVPAKHNQCMKQAELPVGGDTGDQLGS